jgi:chromosome segregation ATPase
VSGHVSQATRRRLHEAMQRLFAGTPQHTDGTLTKNNLWREAQVSRATMNRAVDILAAWDARVAVSPAGVAVRQRDEELEHLRSRLRDSHRERRQLQDQLNAAATVIAALYNENTVLRRQGGDAPARLVLLSRTRNSDSGPLR